jgi:hypothetical protein
MLIDYENMFPNPKAVSTSDAPASSSAADSGTDSAADSGADSAAASSDTADAA